MAGHDDRDDGDPRAEARDSYATVGDGPEVEVTVRGSRFIGQVFALGEGGEEVAAARLGEVRRRYHDATHHCSALRLGPPESPRERFDDDGEPSGTAGRPILGAIHRADLYDVLVVVTRYFGGTKLGTGGLARAYGEAARRAVEAAPRRTTWLLARLEVTCEYGDLGAVEAVLARAGEAVHGVERTFEPGPHLVVRAPRSRAGGLAAAIVEATAGRARVVRRSPGAGGTEKP